MTTTWRDIADQLTPEQIASLGDSEDQLDLAPEAVAQHLLESARHYAEVNLANQAYADVPAPDGAEPGAWEKDNDGGYSRPLLWRSFGDAVDIDGRQQCDGTFTRHISLWAADGRNLTTSEARKLARVLLVAADEMDRISLSDNAN